MNLSFLLTFFCVFYSLIVVTILITTPIEATVLGPITLFIAALSPVGYTYSFCDGVMNMWSGRISFEEFRYVVLPLGSVAASIWLVNIFIIGSFIITILIHNTSTHK